jgi:hypothetical protein
VGQHECEWECWVECCCSWFCLGVCISNWASSKILPSDPTESCPSAFEELLGSHGRRKGRG